MRVLLDFFKIGFLRGAKMRRITQAIMTALPMSIAAGSAQAALIDRGGGLIYDTTLNITWLQNANPIAGTTYDNGGSPTDGRASFESAQAFAASFSYSANGVTYSNWRLPQGIDFISGTPDQTLDGVVVPTPPISGAGWDWQFSGYDCGYNMAPRSNEIVHLYYTDLGNLGQFYDTPATPDNPAAPFIGIGRPGVQGVDWGLVNTGPFINLQSYAYWTSIINPVDPTLGWRHFYTDNGRMSWRLVEEPDTYTMLVADGDIANGAVSHAPEPETYAMLLAGLGMLGFVARRRKRKAAD